MCLLGKKKRSLFTCHCLQSQQKMVEIHCPGKVSLCSTNTCAHMSHIKWGQVSFSHDSTRPDPNLEHCVQCKWNQKPSFYNKRQSYTSTTSQVFVNISSFWISRFHGSSVTDRVSKDVVSFTTTRLQEGYYCMFSGTLCKTADLKQSSTESQLRSSQGCTQEDLSSQELHSKI